MRVSKVVYPMLLLGVPISLFTQLRVSFFGAGEILLLLAFLITFFRPLSRTNFREFVFTRFWLAYLFISMLGMGANYFLLEESTGTPEQMFFDLAAYVFVLMTCFTFERLHFEGKLDIDRFLVHLFFVSGGVLTALYVASFSSSSLYGFTLRYYNHFAPLAVNVHQVSMYLVVLPFLGVLVFFSSPKVVPRILTIALIVAAVAMSIGAATTKADMAIVIGTIVLMYAYSIKIVRGGFRSVVNAIYFGSFLVLLFLTGASDLFFEFFAEADPHGAREQLYSNSLSVIAGSPLVGRGPGPHVLHSGTFWDVHQTHLTILLQAGILGLTAYLVLVVKVLSRVWKNPALVAAFAAVFVYSAGGDILRRLPIWVLLVLIYYWNSPGPGELRRTK